MGTPGRKPKPNLAVVREGQPGHRPPRESVKLPPSPLVEPDWRGRGAKADQLGLDAEVARDAKATWDLLAPTMERSMGMVDEQRNSLIDYCICIGRIRQGERRLSREGMIVEGAQGNMVRHPMVTVLNQYRAQFRTLTGELGLSPASATRIKPPENPGDDDPFD